MKKLVVTASLMLGMLVPASAQDIGGKYTADGTNLDGSAYNGTVEVTLTSDTTCVIKWDTNGAASEGICARNGDSFAAAHITGGEVGLIIYKVAEDGSMDGLWTIAGKEGNGTEKLTPAE
jgi:hypothetical protein